MLLRKMLRDMKLHKTQFISIFLMSLLGVYVFAGIGSEWYGMQTTAEKYYKENNLANAWIYGNGFSEESVDAITDLQGVTAVERRLTLEGTAELDKKPEMTIHFIEGDQISKSHLIDGDKISLDKDGIWLDYLFAEAKDLKVGDSITVSAYGISLSKPILGTVMNPEYVYAPGGSDILPNHDNYGFAYLSYKAFPGTEPIVYNEMQITTDRKIDLTMQEAIDTALDGKYSILLTRKQNSSYMQLNTEIEEHKAMGGIFPVIFLVVALLTILTTMARLVNNQRTQIGILKAIGYKKKNIIYHYVSYGIWISLAGAALGVVLGPLTLPYLFYEPMKTMFTLPQWKPAISLSIIIMAVMSVVLCTITTYMACKNNLKDTPAQALRPKPPKAMKHSVIDRLIIWKKFGFNSQWNLRDAFRSKLRSIMAIVGVMGCTALLVCAFGMQDSMDEFKVWNFSKISRFETKVNLSDSYTEEQFNSIMEEYNGEAMMEGAVELKVNDFRKSGELLVTDHVTLIQSYNSSRKHFELPEDGISISYKMADSLQVEEGDEISWRVYGDTEWRTGIINAIYRTPIAQGITVFREEFEKSGYQFKPTAVLTSDNIIKEFSEKETGVSKVWTKKELTDSFETTMEAMDLLIYVLILAAIVLAVVVLYNLGVLSFTERQRELSTLKVIGFKTRLVRTLLLTQNMWMTTIGVLLGIPVGIWLLGYVLKYMGESFDFIVSVRLISYVYSILGTFLVSVLVNRLFSRRVKSLDMVSSLKGVE